MVSLWYLHQMTIAVIKSSKGREASVLRSALQHCTLPITSTFNCLFQSRIIPAALYYIRTDQLKGYSWNLSLEVQWISACILS